MFAGPACDERRCNRSGDIPNLQNMRTLLTTLLISIALIASGQGIAAQRVEIIASESLPPALSAMQGNGVTLSQAVEQVRRQYNGRIVSAETQVSGDRETHVIKVLTEDGKVKTVTQPETVAIVPVGAIVV